MSTNHINAKAAAKITADARVSMNVDQHMEQLYADIKEAAELGYDELNTTVIREASADGRHQFIIDAMVKDLNESGFKVSTHLNHMFSVKW